MQRTLVAHDQSQCAGERQLRVAVAGSQSQRLTGAKPEVKRLQGITALYGLQERIIAQGVADRKTDRLLSED